MQRRKGERERKKKEKDELIDGLTSAAYRPTSPRKEFVTRGKFEANYKKVSRKAKVSSGRTFHRVGITQRRACE